MIDVLDNSQVKPGRSERELSRVVNLRKFNNWVKAVQISKVAFDWPNGRKATVMDIGCGKGGDMNKWRSVHAHQYIGIGMCGPVLDRGYLLNLRHCCGGSQRGGETLPLNASKRFQSGILRAGLLHGKRSYTYMVIC